MSNATSYPGYQFEWSSNNKSLGINPELLIKDSGTYFLIIINPLAACINSDSIVIKKIEPPTIQIETQDVKCFGDSSGVVSIDIKDGTPPFSIKSKFDFINQLEDEIKSNFMSNPELEFKEVVYQGISSKLEKAEVEYSIKQWDKKIGSDVNDVRIYGNLKKIF